MCESSRMILARDSATVAWLGRAFLFSILCLFAGSAAIAEDSRNDQVDYIRQIKPILALRCYSCHAALKQEGSLRLDTAALLKKGGDSGSALVAGQPSKSRILQKINAADVNERMPPEGTPVSEKEIALLTKWIEQGATAPSDEQPVKDPRQHWAFQPPVRLNIPKVKNADWRTNPIDSFVAARHEQLGLQPQPPAPKHILLRRVYLDLIGLPPQPKELRAFLADDSADAFEKVVDRLLESPQYGERWARHWMDVWRYSDWYGYRAELRNSARHIWRWRDWIIESLNQDRPYNQMIVEMLAADESDPTNANALRATGFLARHYYKFNRNTWLEATIEHTGKAFLGITLNCARCHDHMYDPISQKEYYQFRAIFEPYQVRTDRVAGQADVTKNGLSLVYDANLDVKTYLFKRGNDKRPDKEHPLGPTIPAIFKTGQFKVQPIALPPSAYYPGLRPHIREETLAAAEERVAIAEKALKAGRQKVSSAKRNLTKLKTQAVTGTKSKPVTKPIQKKPDEYNLSIFLDDDFSKARPKTWKLDPGQWEFKAGRLLQNENVAQLRHLTTLKNHPRDFSVTVRVKITGGTTYKSVGLSFDNADGMDYESVYLSAYAAGPKVQAAHTRSTQTTYPQSGKADYPIKVGQEYELRIDVRDKLWNVSIDGKLALIYTSPHARRNGRFSLWTFDSTAEFIHIRMAALSPNIQLVKKRIDKPQPKSPATVADGEALVRDAESASAVATKQLAAARAHVGAVRARIAADDAKYADATAEQRQTAAQKAAKAERQGKLKQVEADLSQAELDVARATRMLKSDPSKKKDVAATTKKLSDVRKSLAAAKEAVQKTDANYAPFSSLYPKTSSGRRLALARWIADRDNPLTARVAVNHIWMRHFGKPLVPTVFDFGMNGKPATHPKLLDWLSVEFMNAADRSNGNHGWSMKHLHRLMVTSKTYRMQSSGVLNAESNVPIDPDNEFLWRMNSRRIEAEVVRDSVLWVSGQLDMNVGGPELDAKLGQTTYRRSIYYRHAPEKFMTFLKLFDAANTNECYRRDETIVPHQALALVNSRLAIEQSRRLASQVNEQLDADKRPAAFIEALFERVLCRPPTDDERSACEQFLIEQTKRFAEPRKLTTFQTGSNLAVKPSADPHLRSRENLAHVLLNHNEFVTLR